jgi:hypothetical protein
MIIIAAILPITASVEMTSNFALFIFAPLKALVTQHFTICNKVFVFCFIRNYLEPVFRPKLFAAGMASAFALPV